MTQSSIAVSANGETWVLLNASPDIRTQLQQTSCLHPRGLRGSPIASVIVTNADVDHIAGLLTLREKTAFDLFSTSGILTTLSENRIFGVLDADLVTRRTLELDRPFTPAPGLTVNPFSVPAKVALFLENGQIGLQELGEQTIGLVISDNTRTLAYLPSCAAIPDWLVERLRDVDLLLFDGTVWQNDDMQRTGTGEKTGARMGHVPMTGEAGSLARLAGISARKMYIHINNTNPVLQPNGPERRALAPAGWEVGQDRMELTL